MAGKVQISDPHGILQEFNSKAPRMVDAQPNVEADLSRIQDRVEKATYLEPLFFHPDNKVRARVAAVCVPIDVMKITDYLVNMMATSDQPTAITAAKAIWQRHGNDNCEYAIDCLRYQADRIGSAKAKQVAKLLIDNAPDQASKTAVAEAVAKRIGAI